MWQETRRVPPLRSTLLAGRAASNLAASVDAALVSWGTVMTTNSRSLLARILLGGFIAGSIDIGAACLINRVGLIVILQAIAGGILGRDSFHDGLPAAALGLALQWAMSILIAAIFVYSTRWLSLLKRRWLAAGLAYGVVIFFVMNYVVLPLSALGRAPHFTALRFVENLLAMLLFGVIVAFCARGASRD